MIFWLTDYTDFHRSLKSCSSLPAGLASPTACAKAIDAYAKASASAHGGASYAKAQQAGVKSVR